MTHPPSLLDRFFDDPMPVIGGALIIAAAVGLLIFTMRCDASEALEQNAAFAPIVSQIKVAKRPRVVVFSGAACSICRKYEPVVAECTAAYDGKADFKIFDLDKHEDFLFGAAVHCGVPGTFIFDRDGKQVYEHNRYLSRAQLDRLIQPLVQ